MNAAFQRRLTPWLIAALALAAAWLLGALLGLGGGVRWDPPRPLAPLPQAHAGAALPPARPLASYAPVWQQPLFSADRKPTASANAAVSLGELELTGIILTPSLHMALLHDKNGDRQVRVIEGAVLPDSGWNLVELKPRSAVFASANGRTELVLPVTAPVALDAASAVTGNPAEPANLASPPPLPSPSALAFTPPPPSSSDAALQRARIEALKAAVQRRRATQQQVPPAPDPSLRDH